MSKFNIARLLALSTIMLSSWSYASAGNKFYVSVENKFPNSTMTVKADTHEDWEIRCVYPPVPSEIKVPYGETSIPIINTTHIVYDYCKPNTLKHIVYYFVVKDLEQKTIANGSFRCEQQGEARYLGCRYQSGDVKLVDKTSNYRSQVTISPK